MHWENEFSNKIFVSSFRQSIGSTKWGEHISTHGKKSASLTWGGSEIFQQAIQRGYPDSDSGVSSINRLLSHRIKVSHYHFFFLSRKVCPLFFPWAGTWYSRSRNLFLIPVACSCGSPGYCWGHSTFQKPGSCGCLAFQRHSEAAGHLLCQG